MSADDSLPELKVLLVGPSSAGKSSLLIRYCEDRFEPDSANATLGVDVKYKKLSVRGQPYRLSLFDTAGQERFRSLSTIFYRGAHGAILVYDISNRASFSDLGRWFDEVKANTAAQVALYLVGAKLDKAASHRAVSALEGQKLAEAHGALFCELSAQTRENVRAPFVGIVSAIVSDPELLEAVASQKNKGRAVKVEANDGWSRYIPGCAC